MDFREGWGRYSTSSSITSSPRSETAEQAARPEYVAADPALILGAISDRLTLVRGAAPVPYPDFMFQHREAANFPWVSQAEWLYTQLVRWDHLAYSA